MKTFIIALISFLFNLPLSSQFIYDNIGSYGNPEIKESKLEPMRINEDWWPFYHGVASGDPTASSVILWARVSPDSYENDPVEVEWRIASDPDLEQILQTGNVQAVPENDFTVKVDVIDLEPGKTYYYGFTAFGFHSLTGRTKTLPDTNTDHIKFAVMVCSNFQSGYFNAYRQVASLNDIDAVIHLGDYIYEYGNGGLADTNLIASRPIEPAHEIISLEDYRARYATYRLDTSCIRVHQQHPFITVWDDHEIANNAWLHGAENHDEDSEGPWDLRKQAAIQAYKEWLPIRETNHDHIYRKFSFGLLAELFMLDTRHAGRDQQLISSQDPALQDPDRSMLGQDQREWIQNSLSQSTSQWKIIGNQVLYSPLNAGWLTILLPEDDYWYYESLFLDTWSGYPAERKKLFDHIANQNIQNVVFATGDLHVAFAIDIPEKPNEIALVDTSSFTQIPIYSASELYDPTTGDGSLAVEFMTPSISAPNFDESYDQLTAFILENYFSTEIELNGGEIVVGTPNPHFKYLDLTNHGFMILNITDELTQADWYHVPLFEPSADISVDASWLTYDQENRVRPAMGPYPPKMNQDLPAPLNPPDPSSAINDLNASALIKLYPNPAKDQIFLSFQDVDNNRISIELLDMNGNIIQSWSEQIIPGGQNDLSLQLDQIPDGFYLVRIRTMDQTQLCKIIILNNSG